MSFALSAAILVGGLGTRLRGVVSDRPKVLAPVAGRPFLCHLLAQLSAAGIQDAALCTGYMADLVAETIGSSYGSLAVSYSKETEPLGTGGALRLALPLLKGETVLVLNGDSYCDMSIQAFHAWHLEKKSAASIAMAQMPDTARFGRMAVDQEGRVEAFIEKGRTGPGWINSGLYLLSREMLQELPGGVPVSLEKDVFPKWVARGALWGCRAEVRRFIDIGTPESFAEAQLVLSEMGDESA